MRTALRTKAIVRTGGVIEICSPDLTPGSVADVVVRLQDHRAKVRKTQKQLAPVPNLGWPAGFFEQTFGSLRDLPLVRGEQGDYDVRDRIE